MRPDVIGDRCRVDHAIDRGGMGTVWLARDELLRRDVAIKQIGLLPGQSETDSARALREARSAAGLGHRNVVTVFDVVEERDAIWLVMEYVEGRSLWEIVAAEGPLDPARVADIGAQVADGLAAAHAVGTIHRDVKPGNVLVRADGLAQISDFGIARSPGDPLLTSSGLLTGTPTYFSPELARGAPPSPAADVWALGATLYAAVQGRPPYRSQDNPVALLHDIVTNRPPAPDRAGFLEPVLQRLLDRDPGSRWSMPDAAHALHRLAAEHAPERTRAQTLWDLPSSSPASRPADSTQSTPVARRDLGDRRDAPRVPPVEAAGSPGPVISAGGTSERSRRPGSPAHPSRPAASRPAGSPPPGSPSDRARPEGSSRGSTGRRAGYALAALTLLLLVGGGIGYALVHLGDDESGTHGATGAHSHNASGSPTSRASASGSAGSTAKRSPTATGTGSGAATTGAGSSGSGSTGSGSTGSGSSGSEPSGSAGDSRQAAFLVDYFSEAPGGTDAGWRQLGPREQAQGRSRYDGFWQGIRSVQVRDVVAVSGSDDVEATLTYLRTDGVTSTERHRLTLLRSGNGYLIDADVPAR